MKIVVLIALVALLLARRIQRSLSFQQYRQSILTIRMVLFTLLALSLLSGVMASTSLLIADGIGIVAGLVLAYIATNRAQFEKREGGLYFKTHIWVEIVVIVLFIVRFSYRLYVLRDIFQSGDTQLDAQTKLQYMHDPFTGFIFLTFCTYYIGYYSFILKEAGKKLNQQ